MISMIGMFFAIFIGKRSRREGHDPDTGGNKGSGFNPFTAWPLVYPNPG
jgi:hypothetical protein